VSNLFVGTNYIVLNTILKIGTNFTFLYIFLEFISIHRNFSRCYKFELQVHEIIHCNLPKNVIHVI